MYYLLDKDPTGHWGMELGLWSSCKVQLEETCTVITADGQDLTAAEGSEVMAIKAFSKAGRSQDWRLPTQLLFTTALVPHVHVYEFCLAEKSCSEAGPHIPFHRDQPTSLWTPPQLQTTKWDQWKTSCFINIGQAI